MSASITSLDAYAASHGELNRVDKKVCRYLRTLSTGKAYDCTATESHGRSWTNSQRGDRNQKSKVVAGNDGAQSRTLADSGGDLGTAPTRGTNIDGRRLLSAFSEPFLSGLF